MDKLKNRLATAVDQGREALIKKTGQHDRTAVQQQPLQETQANSSQHDQSSIPPPQWQEQPFQANIRNAPIVPKINSEPELLGLVGDARLNRDSGGSVRFGDRVLWTYRDTQICELDGKVQIFPIITSTASWSDFDPNGGPKLEIVREADPLKSVVLKQYGKISEVESFFYSPGKHLCHSPAGNRDDGTRIALWPNQPPVVTHETSDGHIIAYTWIPQSHIGNDLSVKTENPATVLYKTEYHPSHFHSRDALPKVHIVQEQFWKQGEISFGSYGTLLHNGYVYLYGQDSNHKTSLARVRPAEVENRSAYEYWVHGEWTKDTPKLGQAGIEIPLANAGGQGTYYFNKHWNVITWIGGDIFPGAEMHVCTAPEPQGPWTEDVLFYTGPRGTHNLGAYSVQAHPALIHPNSDKNEMYLTYTKNDDEEGTAVYTTPLIHIEFE